MDNRPFLVPDPHNATASVALCLCTKTASTSIKRHVLSSLDRRGIPLESDWHTCPHGHPALRGLPTPQHAFIVVRNPLLRLASGYEEVARRSFWHRLPQVPPNASFARVVHAVARTPPSELNPHFRPQWLMCGLVGGRRYTEILKYEDWNHLMRVLTRHVTTNIPPLPFRDTGALARADRLYTRELAEVANRWAHTDLDLFGYEPWWPGQSAARVT